MFHCKQFMMYKVNGVGADGMEIEYYYKKDRITI